MKAYKLIYTYDRNGVPPAWLGVMAPYITFMSSFSNRVAEVRTGTSSFPVSKMDGEIRQARISEYRLNNTHHIHLEGITYPPQKRSAMAQSLGPIAQLIMLHRSRSTPAYQERWRNACARTFGQFPRYQELIDRVLSSGTSEIAPLMEVVADCLTVTSSRACVKAFFPFSMYYSRLSAEQVALMTADPTESMEEDETPVFTAVLIDIGDINHSGRKAFVFYQLCTGVEYSMNIRGDKDVAAEVAFHGIWGSHLESLPLLHYMTNHTFSSRRDLGNAFQGRGTAGEVKFNLIPIRHYSKLSQALQTDYTTGGQVQVWNRITFSGERFQKIGSAFEDYIRRQRTGGDGAAFAGNLFNFYSNYRQLLMNRLRTDGGLHQGKVDWRETASASWDEDGEVVESPGRLRPIFFYADGGAASAAQEAVAQMEDV